MGLETLRTRANGEAMDENWFNLFKRVLTGILVPRNSDGEAEDCAGDLGSSTYRFARAHIEVGYHFCGEIKYKYDFNGTVTIEQGWMLCDGRTINEANYDTEHGAGSWDLYIGTSPVDGKKLPTSNTLYLAGTSGATQSGASTITRVGNVANTLPSLTHNHGGSLSLPASSASQGALRPLDFGAGVAQANRNHVHSLTIPNNLTSTYKAEPASIAFKQYLRII